MSSSPQASFAALSHASFRSFTLAGMLWMMGDNIEHVISYWAVFEEFESQMLGGYAVISHWAPFLLGGVFGGSLADRYDCRKLFLIAMAMFMAVSLGWALIFWLEIAAIWQAVLLLTLHGIAGVVFTPASQVIIHDIVGDERLPSAVRLTATSRQIGLLLGPAVGGGLLLAFGPALGLALNALFYVPMVWWSLREKYTGHGDLDPAVRARRPLVWGLGSALETLRQAADNRLVISMTALVGLTSLLVGNAYQAQMPEFAKSLLADDEGVLYTALLVAGAAGAIFGGLVQETLPVFEPSPGKAVWIAVLWSLSMLVFAAAPHYGLALPVLFISGALLISFTSMAQALVQLEAPPQLRGRVVGVFNMSLNGLRIGSGVSVGFLGAVIGIHWSLGISSAILSLSLLPLLRFARPRRGESKPLEIAGMRR